MLVHFSGARSSAKISYTACYSLRSHCCGSQTRAPHISRDANTGAGQDLTGLAAAVRLRLRVASLSWVANFDSEVPALTRREHGANPWRPTISPMWLSSDSSSFVNCRATPRGSASLSIGSNFSS